MKKEHTTLTPRPTEPVAPRTKKLRRLRGSLMLDGMIGIAIIGIVYTAFVSKAFGVLKSGRYTQVIEYTTEMENAAALYIKKNGGLGTLPCSEGTIPTTQFTGTGTTSPNVAAAATIDQLFLAEGFIRAPVTINFGSVSTTAGSVGVTWVPTTAKWTATAAPTLDYSNAGRVETQFITAAVPGTDGSNFDLQGKGSTTYLSVNALNHVVLELILPNVPIGLAQELSNEIDGPSLSASDTVSADTMGKVNYAAPGTNKTTTVYVYIIDL